MEEGYWLDRIPEPHRSAIKNDMARYVITKEEETHKQFIESVRYQPRLDQVKVSVNISIQLTPRYEYWISFQDESNNKSRIFHGVNDRSFGDLAIKEGSCIDTSHDWIINFFEQSTGVRFLHVYIAPCKKGSIVPLIVANKIWINGHFETEENGLVAWWISQFRPGIYGIQISAKQEMVHIKHLEHLRRAAVLHVKGHTDVDETTILEFRGTCLRIDDWSKPNYDGMTLLSVLENYIEDGEKQDLIINNKWIDYEFWKPVEEFLRLLVDDFEFDSDEHRLFFSYHFRRFQLIVECLPGHFSVQILVPS